MQLTFGEYRDKVRACWLGKNIGGTLGAPFEGFRGVYDISYYTHDIKKGVLPNDDVDLQLVWLNAAERYGRNVNAEILGEYWLSYVTADWSEYGAGKNNMRYGLVPPLSGWYNNHNRDSCGCFIRSELWACLAPGHPEIAVRYAYEDAVCDHAYEGMYAEIFCAALQSAAFVESDRGKLLDAALSYIPKDCAIAGAVALVLECRRQGMDWKGARKRILQEYPGSFGMAHGYLDQEPEGDVPVGPLGYDAPGNIGILMIGWLYGDGDFSRSICIAAGCCEDADCTAGTLGAILGILGGTGAIDERWLAPIGDEIKTCSVDVTKRCLPIPKTVTELSQRVVNLMPVFLHGYCSLDGEGRLQFAPVESMYQNTLHTGFGNRVVFSEEIGGSPVHVRKEGCLFDVKVSYDGSLSVSESAAKRFHVTVRNRLHSQQWLTVRLQAPECWRALPAEELSVYLDQNHGGHEVTEIDFAVVPERLCAGRHEILLELVSCGRLSRMYVVLPLLTGWDGTVSGEGISKEGKSEIQTIGIREGECGYGENPSDSGGGQFL